jgi:CBS domain-containing protein
MHVKDVLANKGAAVATVAPGSLITEVIASLAEHHVGALVVTSDGRQIEGIVSERDVVRALHTRGADLLATQVSEIMTSNVLTCSPDDEVRSLAKTMTDKRFRHMPVVVDGALAGIVTIGDIVKIRLDELQTEHDQLVTYISSTG